jgi:predicted porin
LNTGTFPEFYVENKRGNFYMTKNILAIAIAAAVMAPSAFAAATVYGSAHMSVDSASNLTDNAATGTTKSQSNVNSNSSYVGIKGSEDLGAGMKAVFQFENQVGFDGDQAAAASNTGFQGQRNSYVGLGGSFGTVLLGIHDTPLKMVGRKYDMFSDRIGDTRNISAGNGTGVNFDARPANVIAYASPTFGGVSALIAYVNDENGAAVPAATPLVSGDTSALSAMIGYAAGDLTVDGAYETHGAGFSTASNQSLAAYRLGAGYGFGSVKVQGFFGNQDVDLAAGKKSRDIYGAGASMKVGAAGTIKAQYAVAAKYNSLDNGADLMAVGYDHAMSKNTTAYVAYAAANNASAATYAMNGGGHQTSNVAATLAGKDPSAFSVGLIHKF